MHIFSQYYSSFDLQFMPVGRNFKLCAYNWSPSQFDKMYVSYNE